MGTPKNIVGMQLEPRPSSYPLVGPKYPLLGTIHTYIYIYIHPQLRVQGGSWNIATGCPQITGMPLTALLMKAMIAGDLNK